MQHKQLPHVAIIADAHLHDVYSNYDGASIDVNGETQTLRSWVDTRRSSRVFNESRMALLASLDSIVERGIRVVVLLGDYSDDGQSESIQRVVDILERYERSYGIRFFAIPGNHDYYGPCGKHQSTRFAINPTKTALVTSDQNTAATEPDSAVLTPKMYCPGALDALAPMRSFGLIKNPEYLHWETPFGQDDDLAKRSYTAYSADGKVSYPLTDSSYLVEPAKGLWLLMLDANVFEPRNGEWSIEQKKAFLDSSDAGWNSVLRCKRFLLDWIHDVSKRAKAKGKCLITFSHYPAMDPFNDSFGVYEKLFGITEITKRQPSLDVARELLTAGVTLHFGGHMHVNARNQTTLEGTMFTNVAVPSPVAFPPAYCVVKPDASGSQIQNISLSSLPLDSGLMQFYENEESALTGSATSPALSTKTYGEFLYKRLYSRLEHRYIKKDWPSDIAAVLGRTNTLDLLYLLMKQEESKDNLMLMPIDASCDQETLNAIERLLNKNALSSSAFANQPMMDFLVDWYGLRDAGDMAMPFIDEQKINRYRFLAAQYGDPSLPAPNNHQAFFKTLLSLLHHPLEGLTPVSC